MKEYMELATMTVNEIKKDFNQKQLDSLLTMPKEDFAKVVETYVEVAVKRFGKFHDLYFTNDEFKTTFIAFMTNL